MNNNKILLLTIFASDEIVVATKAHVNFLIKISNCYHDLP